MIESRVPPIDEPRPFEPHELFFSLTDPKGLIRHGNRVFCRVAGYEEAELIGQPHNLIRHPDVPRCVFRLLWRYLEAGRTIAAYVKNLAADGRYYWVLAAVTPCPGGYLSVRLNPSTPLFEAAKAVYADVLKLEAQVEQSDGRKPAMEASTQRMLELLADHGFADYDAFMHAAMRAEVDARATPPPTAESATADPLEQLPAVMARVGEVLGRVFASLDVFDKLSGGLAQKQAAMEELGPSLSTLALNAHISSSRLHAEGSALGTISRLLRERSGAAGPLIERINERIARSCEVAHALSFGVALARLEADVCTSFAIELREDAAAARRGQVVESLQILAGELGGRCDRALRDLGSLLDDVAATRRDSAALVRQVEVMRQTQVSGRIEVAARNDYSEFNAIFDEVARIVQEARADCDEVAELLADASLRLAGLVGVESELRASMATVDRVVDALVTAG